MWWFFRKVGIWGEDGFGLAAVGQSGGSWVRVGSRVNILFLIEDIQIYFIPADCTEFCCISLITFPCWWIFRLGPLIIISKYSVVRNIMWVISPYISEFIWVKSSGNLVSWIWITQSLVDTDKLPSKKTIPKNAQVSENACFLTPSSVFINHIFKSFANLIGGEKV